MTDKEFRETLYAAAISPKYLKMVEKKRRNSVYKNICVTVIIALLITASIALGLIFNNRETKLHGMRHSEQTSCTQENSSPSPEET